MKNFKITSNQLQGLSMSKVALDMCYPCNTARLVVLSSKVNNCANCGTSATFIQRRKFQRKLNTGVKIQPKPSLLVDTNGRIKTKTAPKTWTLKGFSATETDLEDKCTICYCEFEIKDQLYKTSCSHKFHTGCLGKWLDRNKTCPQCLSPVETESKADDKKKPKNTYTY